VSSVGRRPPRVSGAVDLDDELHRRGTEVGNEAPDDPLPPDPNPELPAAQVNPRRRLRRSERRPHMSSMLNDERLMRARRSRR
jgi:hypothetical protein